METHSRSSFNVIIVHNQKASDGTMGKANQNTESAFRLLPASNVFDNAYVAVVVVANLRDDHFDSYPRR